MNYNDQYQQMMNDPQGMAQQKGYTIPDSLKDPREMVQHLLRTGQINNGLLQRAIQLARMGFIK